MSDVAIIMGSDSDWPTMEAAANVLEEFGITYTADVISADMGVRIQRGIQGATLADLVASPGTAKDFSYNVDSLAMFQLKNPANAKAQRDLSSALMSPDFQELFNLNKGSIPVRLNMPMDKFDACAKQSAKDFVESSKGGTLVPSIAHGMAVPSAVEGAIKDVVSQFWNSDKATED